MSCARSSDRCDTISIDPDQLAELAFMHWLRSAGFLHPKPLLKQPGMWVAIRRLIFHYSIQGGVIGDFYNAPIRYCYTDDFDACKAAFDAWDGEGEPTGWQKHPPTGRRRPNGDPSREHSQW